MLYANLIEICSVVPERKLNWNVQKFVFLFVYERRRTKTDSSRWSEWLRWPNKERSNTHLNRLDREMNKTHFNNCVNEKAKRIMSARGGVNGKQEY